VATAKKALPHREQGWGKKKKERKMRWEKKKKEQQGSH